MKVFYNPKQYKKVYRVPLEKIPRLVELWTQNQQIQIVDYIPLVQADLYSVHSKKYVDGIFDGTIQNGFGNQNPAIAQMELYQVSSFVAAAKQALVDKIACSPTAGFHHATYDFSGMYCVFNGLMMAAETLKKQNLVNKVGILDLDFHYGDGTEDIIKKLDLDYIVHWGFYQNWVPSSFLFFQKLIQGLERMKDCDIILYQAGMDMYKDDPNGGLLTVEELRKRDALVFQWAKAHNKPIVWTLAGGYTDIDFLVSLHHITMEEALKVFKP